MKKVTINNNSLAQMKEKVGEGAFDKSTLLPHLHLQSLEKGDRIHRVKPETGLSCFHWSSFLSRVNHSSRREKHFIKKQPAYPSSSGEGCGLFCFLNFQLFYIIFQFCALERKNSGISPVSALCTLYFSNYIL